MLCVAHKIPDRLCQCAVPVPPGNRRGLREACAAHLRERHAQWRGYPPGRRDPHAAEVIASSPAMKIYLSPQLAPTMCLPVDSPAAGALTWLPYAVRFKLDACALRISLREWQGLQLRERQALVLAHLVRGIEGFRAIALASGATADHSGPRPEVVLTASDYAGLVQAVVSGWRVGSTPLARYVLRKIANKKQAHATT